MGKKVLFSVAALVVFALAVFFLWPNQPPKRTLPNPNGYDLLIEAAKDLSDPPYGKESTTDELREYVTANSNALERIIEALEVPCAVPEKTFFADMTLDPGPIMASKRGALALEVAGLLAERQGEHEQAAQHYMQCIALGQNITRNGVLIDMLVGVACETIGARGLERVLPHLDGDVCAMLAAKLEAAELDREPLNSVIENEYNLMRSQPGLKARFEYHVYHLRQRFSANTSVIGSSAAKYENRINNTKLLTARLASRAYEAETGKKPARFEDLVPKYLKAVPTDSQTGTALAFKFSE